MFGTKQVGPSRGYFLRAFGGVPDFEQYSFFLLLGFAVGLHSLVSTRDVIASWPNVEHLDRVPALSRLLLAIEAARRSLEENPKRPVLSGQCIQMSGGKQTACQAVFRSEDSQARQEKG